MTSRHTFNGYWSRSRQTREALRQFAQAAVDDEELEEDAREAILESVALLAEEAGKQPDKRRRSIIRTTLAGLAASMAAAGGAAEVWSTAGPTITQFFGG